jgi:hypothetical protein
MNERITQLAERARGQMAVLTTVDDEQWRQHEEFVRKFAELIVAECIDKIETYRIPVGNSAAGEMACEWTYDALKEIRGEIKKHFGVEE